MLMIIGGKDKLEYIGNENRIIILRKSEFIIEIIQQAINSCKFNEVVLMWIDERNKHDLKEGMDMIGDGCIVILHSIIVFTLEGGGGGVEQIQGVL